LERGDARRPSRAWGLPVTVVALLLAALATRLVVADYQLAVAQDRMAGRDVAAAKTAYETHKTWALPGRSADLYYSRAMAALATGSAVLPTKLAASAEAMQAGTRAVRYSEQRANSWYSLATLFAGGGDRDAVERCLRNAIAWAPNWFKPHWALAQLLELSGRRDEALREAEAAVQRDGGKNPEVLATWSELERAQRSR
jgi:tetratricopeptide (TPR) repeat protein